MPAGLPAGPRCLGFLTNIVATGFVTVFTVIPATCLAACSGNIGIGVCIEDQYRPASLVSTSCCGACFTVTLGFEKPAALHMFVVCLFSSLFSTADCTVAPQSCVGILS